MGKAGFKLTATAAMLAGSMTAAAAADMPVKAPMFAPVVAAYDWSGWYAGVGIGGLWGDSTFAYPLDPARAASYAVPFEQAMLGTHGGYQWQFRTGQSVGIVLGMEYGASFNLSEFRDGTDCTPVGGAVALTCQTRLESLYTIGGKLGFAWDRFMLYGSGGWAGGVVNTREMDTATTLTVNGTHAWHSGWYAGAGIDYVFYQTKGSDWILGVEYQHVDFSDAVRHFVGTAPVGIATRDVDLTADYVRAKLTVKLNGPYGLFGGGGPVVAKY